MSDGSRYCPTCGARNDAGAAQCARCGLVFAQFAPAPVRVMKGDRDQTRHIVLWLLGAMVFIMVAFATYFLSVHRLVAGDETGGRNTLQDMAERSGTLFDRLRAAQDEAELERIHGEIGGMLATLAILPEGQDMGTNLLLQRTLYEMDALTRAGAVRDDDSLRPLAERLAVIRRSVLASSPPKR